MRYILLYFCIGSSMPTTIFGSQFFSGIGAELRHEQFTAICASQDIDLATHLLPAGDYTINVNVVMGKVNIYVPKHVTATVDGTVLFGSTNSHNNGNGWQRFARHFGSRANSRNGSPTIAYPDTSGQVRLRIRINGFLGTVRIYRLSHEAEMLRPGMVAVGA